MLTVAEWGVSGRVRTDPCGSSVCRGAPSAFISRC
nr:MAG TPA: hypothetical protein [Bacteriophage sp.]